MRPFVFAAAMLGSVCVNAEVCAQASPQIRSPNTIQQLFQYLYQCAQTPPASEGFELTLRFSLTPYGALRGRPMITYARLSGSVEEQRVFVSATLAAVEKCLPVPLTEEFGKVVAQKVIVMRLPRPRERQI
jgi:hypothetical protein